MSAIEAADLVIIPCRPGILDLRAIGATAKMVRLAQKSAFVLLNAMPTRSASLLADASAAVEQHGLKVAPVALQQRAAFAHALTAGMTASEYEPSGKASQEVSALLKWVRKTLPL